MDLKTLLEQIRDKREKLDAATRIIAICDGDFYRGGILAEPTHGNERYLSISKEFIREMAFNQKQIFEAELAILEDAKETAERVVSGLLPDDRTSA